MEELLNSELAVIYGGEMSEKSRNIGIVLTIISPIVGAGYWFGYYVNSWWNYAICYNFTLLNSKQLANPVLQGL